MDDRFQAFRTGFRPENLAGGRAPDRRAQEAFEVHRRRLERSPIRRAMAYKKTMTDMGCRGVRDFARRTGEDWSVVARHLRLLRLPDSIIGFLEENETLDILRHFTVKHLDELTRMPARQATASFARQVNALWRAGQSKPAHMSAPRAGAGPEGEADLEHRVPTV